MSITIRPYQADAIESVEEHFRQHQRVLGVMFTGGGKTVLFAELLRRRQKLGRAMVLAHRLELIEQAAEKIAWVTGLPVDIEMADRTASELIKTPIVVSSVQTQISGRNGNRRMHRFEPREFASLVIDEAHHGTADSYTEIVDYYASNPRLKVLGVTATPNRNDQIALGSVFESCAFRIGIVDGIKEGWLVPLKLRYVEIAGLDLSKVGTVAGDFNQGQLGAAMETDEVTKATALAALEQSAGRKTLIFCASVDQAMMVSAYLNGRKDGCSRFVCGETDKQERFGIVDDFRKNKFQFLCNYSVFLEGFDVWDVACIVNARPTKNALLLEQMIGRGTRPDADAIDGIESATGRRGAIAASCKPDSLIVDFIGEIGAHKLARLIDVLCGKLPEDVRELAEEKVQSGVDLDDAIAQARAELAPIKVRGDAKYRKVVEAFDLFRLDFEPGIKPIENWQREKLEGWRMPIPSTSEEADDLINEFRRRTREGLATYRMAQQLKRRGKDPDMSFEEARVYMQEWFGNK